MSTSRQTTPGSRRLWSRLSKATVLTGVGAVVLVLIPLVAALTVQYQRGGPVASAAGQIATLTAPVQDPALSPISYRPPAAFECRGKPTAHVAQADGVVLGITDEMFCAITPGMRQIGGAAVSPAGALRSSMVNDGIAAGVVAASVDTVRWIPDGDDSAATSVDLYALGSLRGFAFPADESGGTLFVYSGSTVVTWQWSPA